jgi:hypothetical protein
MTPGQSRIDLEISEAKLFSFLDRLRAWNRFARGSKDVTTSFFAQPWQIRNVIGVCVRKENELHV